MSDLSPGDLIWLEPAPSVGREQTGRRPALVVAGADYLSAVNTLAIVVPITTVDRRWPNHIAIEGGSLDRKSWAMTEQVGTISRERIAGRAGRASEGTLAAARQWLRDFLEF
jgi:mRNA interferase MazF